MKIKRFHAKSMREAIRMVRDEQGPDAVILSNRRIPGGVEVVAAVDYDAALFQQSARPAVAATAPAKAASPQASSATTDTASSAARKNQTASASVSTAAAGSSSAAPTRVTVKAEKVEEEPVVRSTARSTVEVSGAIPAAAVAAPVPASTVATLTVPSVNTAKLESEILTMRRMLEEQLAGLMWGDMKRSRPRQASALRTLAEMGIEPDLARSIAEEVPDSSDAERARFLPLGLLGRRIPVEAGDPVMEGGVIALVGPTGVGKTTTIAKLAARFAERHGVRDIALVTTDHYRVGAPEQLYTYGRLLGVPVYNVGANDNLAGTLARLEDRRLVLVDTAGLSYRDKTLDTQISKLRSIGPRLKSYLVLACNAQTASMVEALRCYSALQLRGCVLTKLDEAERIGGALTVCIRRALPVAYYCDGQRVPEDLYPARSDRLVLRATQLARQSTSTLDDEVIATGFHSTVAHANV
jgi:flagellar biosynthesis protein FlhF